MVKPPTLLLLLSYGLFFAAWDAQTATALSLNGLRADLHASVGEERHKNTEGGLIDRSEGNGISASSGNSRFGLKNAAQSIAQSLRAFFQGVPFVQQSPPTVAELSRGFSAQEWEAAHTPGKSHWQATGLEEYGLQDYRRSFGVSLSAMTATELPSFLLTGSSALRFQHRLRTA